jgi:hypothetical protein
MWLLLSSVRTRRILQDNGDSKVLWSFLLLDLATVEASPVSRATGGATLSNLVWKDRTRAQALK